MNLGNGDSNLGSNYGNGDGNLGSSYGNGYGNLGSSYGNGDGSNPINEGGNPTSRKGYGRTSLQSLVKAASEGENTHLPCGVRWDKSPVRGGVCRQFS